MNPCGKARVFNGFEAGKGQNQRINAVQEGEQCSNAAVCELLPAKKGPGSCTYSSEATVMSRAPL